MVLSEFAKSYIKEHALKESPNEACGVFYVSEAEFAPLPYACKNISENTKDFFMIDPKDYLKASVRGSILAFYHSHPSNETSSVTFSDFDKINAENTKLTSILYSVKNDSFHEYKPIGYELPYIHRQYVVGFIDCYSLIKDYYSKELNIYLSEMDHPFRFIDDKANHPDNNKVYNILLDHFVSNGFININNLKKHDIILIKTIKIKSPIHCMIYRGDNEILHHPFKRYSLAEPYSKAFKNYTTNTMRHNSLV